MSTYDYSNGKIYTIRSHQTNKYYIGSTRMNTLAQRLGKHRSNYKDYLKDNIRNNYISSFDLLMYNDHYIELLEDYPCSSKEQLFKREGELQRQHKSDVVNNNIAGRTQKEHYNENVVHFNAYSKKHYYDNIGDYKANSKVYYETHKEEIKAYKKVYNETRKECQKQYNKQYHELNKEAIAEQKKQHYEANKEEIKANHKLYYETHKEEIKAYKETHKDEIKAKQQNKFYCECGSSISTDNISRHNKTTKHLNYIQQQPITQSPATITEPEIK